MTENAAPLVSIVIPTYNHARYLGRALQSVLDQTYKHWEAIVVDNHSTDNTNEIMASFVDPRLTYLKIHNNGVIAASRNAGIRAAKGEWVAFLDSDDWWALDKLQKCFDHINEQVDLVYHDLEIVNNLPVFFCRKKIKSWQVVRPALIDLLVNGNAIVNSSVVVRKRLLDKIGGIDENSKMIAAEDYNAWLRIAQITDHFCYINETLGYYLQHDQGVSRKDMSIPARHACAEFMYLLNGKQKVSLESNLEFSGGLFAYTSGNYELARKKMVFCLRYARFPIRLKSFVVLTMTLKKIVASYLRHIRK